MVDQLSAKVSSKGQVTLPASLRSDLGIKTGDRLDFRLSADGRVELLARTGTLADLRGVLGKQSNAGGPSIVDLVEKARDARAGEIAKSTGGRRR